MSSSTPSHKFLIDENVKRKLALSLKSKNFDIEIVTKAATDNQIALISKRDSRILITNDKDFGECTKQEIFSVILLRIDFEGNVIILNPNSWDSFELAEEV
ncbi:MAG: hypothetical protein US96_C0016G0020 [Candidatus Woesebacteria bacterium GW2011_GWB1_38_5b]|uniref:DUF5615 domain-containing protein n=1 Tax=Candidatus Woesebacteria bacterium GW2011_GWB1_38_5b TaxID=1618569 RepID=A0A0G0NDK7_9BACT|nr:MAG: hypothetical protein US96_C0016G0020 [Candidatus Woesebacteria bacterium GW2011_GWB1_38_5b]